MVQDKVGVAEEKKVCLRVVALGFVDLRLGLSACDDCVEKHNIPLFA